MDVGARRAGNFLLVLDVRKDYVGGAPETLSKQSGDSVMRRRR